MVDQVKPRLVVDRASPVIHAALTCGHHARKGWCRRTHNIERFRGIAIGAVVVHERAVVGICLEYMDSVGTYASAQNIQDPAENMRCFVPFYPEPDGS